VVGHKSRGLDHAKARKPLAAQQLVEASIDEITPLDPRVDAIPPALIHVKARLPLAL